jgi:malic enzyme
MLSDAHEVPDSFFLVAAGALAECVEPQRLSAGAIYPEVSMLRKVSAQIAAGVIAEARRLKIGRRLPDSEIETVVRDSMWYPDYASC